MRDPEVRAPLARAYCIHYDDALAWVAALPDGEPETLLDQLIAERWADSRRQALAMLRRATGWPDLEVDRLGSGWLSWGAYAVARLWERADRTGRV